MVRVALASLVVLFSPLWLFAQGVLIEARHPVPLPRPIPMPRPVPQPQVPPVSYGIDELKIEGQLRDQIAEINVSQTFRNTGSQTIEAQFVFPLPYDGAVDSLTLMVNGKEFPAKLLTADEARRQYESIVRRNRDPALLQWIGTGMFQTNVFPIPAGEVRTVTLHYSQLLRQSDQLIDFLFPLTTARYSSVPVGHLSLKLSVESSRDIKNLYSPSHAVSIVPHGARQATVSFDTRQTVPVDDFRLFIDRQAGDVGATMLSYRPLGAEDGYFLLLASPELPKQHSERIPKSVIFVIDKSGSMSGKKMEQTQAAARFLVRQLEEGDLFNLISFDSSVNSFRPELQTVIAESRAAALTFVDNVFAGGSTNIYDSLTQALHQLQDLQRPSYVLLLTDGQPTTGETNEGKIAEAAKSANQVRARLQVFGVGYDVNSRLLDRLSRDHHGVSEYVRPTEDVEAAVARVFNRISRPVLTGVKLSYTKVDGTPVSVNRIYPGGDLDLFAGEQLVVVGRYRESGDIRIHLKGNIKDAELQHGFDGKFSAPSSDSTNAFIARLWATRRIGELIDELDLNGRNEELVKELVQLSTQYGILTPYTSFLADDQVRPELTSSENFRRADKQLGRLSEAEGQWAFEQRGAKQSFKAANQAAAPASSHFSLSGGTGLLLGDRGGPAGMSESALLDTSIVTKGDQTLYRRAKLIMTPQTAHLDLEKDKSQITNIERYSPEYFELVKLNTKTENEILSEQTDDEQLLVQLRGVNYLIR